jgi:hypothetical protein
MKIWKYEHMNIWKYENMKIWASKNDFMNYESKTQLNYFNHLIEMLNYNWRSIVLSENLYFYFVNYINKIDEKFIYFIIE